MNKLDFQALNLAMDPATVLPQWLPQGYVQGKEYVSPNPTRNDRTPGSFTINLKEGHWKDYATGDGGSDLVSLYAYLFHQNDQGEAAKELAQNLGVKIGDPVVREEAAKAVAGRIVEAKPEPIMPVPFAATAPDFKHFRYGEPTATYTYMDADGDVLLYVCRFDPPGERKQVVPRSWCKHPDGTTRWTWRGITGATKRPLYGLDKLAAAPDADVVLVEGEKATDAGQQLLGDAAVVVSWMGGTDTADRANLKPLAGRRVILWPDADAQRERLTKEEEAAGVDPESKPLLPLHEQPGMRAMMQHAQALKGVAREVHMVAYTMDAERHGWDLADALAKGWSGADVLEYMGKNTGDPRAIAAGKPPAPPAPPPAAAPPGGDNEPEPPRVPLDADVNPFGWSHMGDKGAPMNTIENLEYMLGEYGITARYNVIKKDVEINIPGLKFSRDNHIAASIATIGSLCARNRMPRSDLVEYMMVMADRNEYNPAALWIDSKPWDGIDRMGDLAATLDPKDAALAVKLLRRWMIGAVGCVYEPEGMSMQGVLVLQGPQNAGKTTWFWSLTDRNKKLAKEGASLNPSDRDSVKGAISFWLCELGELDATFRKADIAALKSFLTKDTDELFLRYSRASSTFPRRTAFVGTVNPTQYLHDETGNRRYWTIRHGEKLRGMHDVNMQQCWAQAKALWVSGEQHRLTREEMDALNEVNLEHTETNPIEELILARYQWGKPGTRAMSATEVLLDLRYDKPNNAQAKSAGAVLRKLTGAEPKPSNGRKVFMMPPRVPQEGEQSRFRHHDEDRPF